MIYLSSIVTSVARGIVNAVASMAQSVTGRRWHSTVQKITSPNGAWRPGQTQRLPFKTEGIGQGDTRPNTLLMLCDSLDCI